MSEKSKSSRVPAIAELEAAEWLIKHDRGLTGAEQDEFLHWLAANPSHQQWLVRHRQTWNEFNLLAQWRPEHSADPNPDLLARPRRRRMRPWQWSAVMLAAAASVTLGWMFWPARVTTPSADVPDRIVAAAYEQRVLADGSVVDLNSGTQLTVLFTEGERRIELLRGEAQFTVAKNPDRPFIVRAGGVDVRAVGTAFNVRLEAAEVEVLVTKGKVQVTRPLPPTTIPPIGPEAATVGARVEALPPQPSSPELIAGQRAVIPLRPGAPAPRVVATSAEDMSRLLAWQPQLLDFDSTPLGNVVADFNRRNRIQLIVEDDELKSIPIVASFRSDNIDGFVRLLQITAEVRVERRGANEIVLRKAK